MGKNIVELFDGRGRGEWPDWIKADRKVTFIQITTRYERLCRGASLNALVKPWGWVTTAEGHSRLYFCHQRKQESEDTVGTGSPKTGRH